MNITIDKIEIDGEKLSAVVKIEGQLKQLFSENRMDRDAYHVQDEVRNRLLEHCTQKVLDKHAENIINGIDVMTLKNAVVLRTAGRISG